MEVLDYLIARLKRGIITFVNMVSLAHRDYPYHDYHTATTTANKATYRVGQNNMARQGDQFKHFTSKSLLVLATTATYLIFNSVNNVPILIQANTYFEFKSNIYAVHFYYSAAEGTIHLWPEGVLPQEARRPE